MRALDPAATLPLDRFPLFRPAPGSVPGTRTLSLPAGRSFPITSSDAGDLYVVDRGVVVTIWDDPARTRESRPPPARVLAAGETFGRWPGGIRVSGENGNGNGNGKGTQDGDPPTLLVRALAPSELLVVPIPALVGPEANGPAVGWLMVAVAQQAERWEHAWLELATQPVVERVAAQLARLAAAWGRPVPGGRAIAVFLSQETIAALVAASRESVNRALRELTATGRIARHGRLYVVSDPEVGPDGTGRSRPGPGAPPSLRARA
jgi:hypothetical protein